MPANSWPVLRRCELVHSNVAARPRIEKLSSPKMVVSSVIGGTPKSSISMGFFLTKIIQLLGIPILGNHHMSMTHEETSECGAARFLEKSCGLDFNLIFPDSLGNCQLGTSRVSSLNQYPLAMCYVRVWHQQIMLVYASIWVCPSVLRKPHSMCWRMMNFPYSSCHIWLVHISKHTFQDLEDVKFRSFTGNFLEDSPKKSMGFMMDFHRRGARSLGICPNEMDTIGWSLVVPWAKGALSGNVVLFDATHLICSWWMYRYARLYIGTHACMHAGMHVSM